ncbi:carboxyl-terminal protease [Alkaliphilus metalliredigens QYMF]|uniref:Carboxyl-terminal protease n=1 Tax=Alkaliphilus metalliredigens (strain QYMF) TaxID=293826 RepID=A6TVJ1_ALKMQ|nr:S41 family peptidase [Alkaliphilus metalliredigens]ABR50209.1 carboxyl-terminal protease [Alkaliphilus metalliredigens QYMF]
MISKKKALIGVVIIVILTTILNLTLGNMIALKMGQKVVVTRDTYEFYQTIKNEYGKMFALKDFLETNYYREIEPEHLVEGAIKGMFEGIGDPYTNYLSQREFEDLMTRTQGTYGGIGVIVTPGDDGMVTVVSPIEDTPGERAGLRTGDKIMSVNGEPISGDRLDKAVEMMKGEPGTEVRLSIWREGLTEAMDVRIQREEIRLQTVRSEIVEGNIGYVRISMFDEKTANDFKTQVDQLQQENIEGLILDLRNNPGGLLSQCVEIADYLLGEQVIVYTEDRQGNREVERSDRREVALPMVVLVNEGSASASEILAGAIKDGERGTIVGTTTFGKGLVQQVKPLDDGTGFKFTVSEYFTPNGTNIHGTGIEPDVIVERPEGIEGEPVTEADEDPQLEKSIEVIKSKMN